MIFQSVVEGLLTSKEVSFQVTFQGVLHARLQKFYSDYTNTHHDAGLMKEGVDVYVLLFHPMLAGIRKLQSDKKRCKWEEQTRGLDYVLN